MVARTGRTVAFLGAALVVACATAGPQPTHMEEHDSHADGLRIAVMQGDTETARYTAEWLFEHEGGEGFPEWSTPFEVGFRQAARVLAVAQTPADAAMGAARLLETCGSCHAAVPGGPIVELEEIAPGSYDTGSHMIRHFWATERMAAGLVGPSEEAWNEGLDALADMAIDPSEMNMSAQRQDEAGQVGVRLHALAAGSRDLTSWYERAEAYGTITYQCAVCHTLRR